LGYNGGYYDEDGTIRRYRDLESPAARHETRRIGKAAGLAAAGSFDEPFGMIAAMIMARANRAAEAKAVAELAPVPENRTQVTSVPSASRSVCAGPTGTS